MKILNDSELTVGIVPGRVQHPKRTATLIVKGTFDLVPDGIARLAEEQLYTSGDIPYDDGDETGELRYESDFAFFKPAADLLLVGSCRPPRPVPRARVRFQVGRHGRELHVLGDREVAASTFRKKIGEPARFDEMPLRYTRAYGSPDDPFNPVGCGAEARGTWRKKAPPSVAPNIVDPQEAPPAGFAPLGRMWGLRREKAGTYDDAWLDGRWPWFPEDFDWEHFNAAPPQMQVRDYLHGDEPVELDNLVEGHPRFECRLPGLAVRCFWSRVGESPAEASELRMNLDTLWIDADALQLVLVWRGVEVVQSEEFDDVELVYVAAEPIDRPLADSEYRRRVAAALAPTPEVDDAAAEHDEAPGSVASSGHQAEVAEEEPEPEFVLDAETQALFDGIGKTPEQVIAELVAAHPVPEEPDEEPDDDSAPWDADRLMAAREAGDDLRELPLTGLDLSGRDLSGADLSRSNLDGADLSGAKLSGAVLAGCDLRNARLVETDLEGALLAEVELAGAVLDRTRLSGADLAGMKAAGVRWTGVDLTEVSAAGATLTGARFVDVDLRDCDLQQADLTGTSWTGCKLFQADLAEARLDDAVFDRCDLGRCVVEGVTAPRLRATGCDLAGFRASEGADFSDACFAGCEGPGSIWFESTLEGADLSGSTWKEANFSKIRGARVSFVDAELSESRFIGARLTGARFDGANLFRAVLEKAELADAVLQKANLFQAGLMEADLIDADLRGANTGMTLLETRGKTT